MTTALFTGLARRLSSCAVSAPGETAARNVQPGPKEKSQEATVMHFKSFFKQTIMWFLAASLFSYGMAMAQSEPTLHQVYAAAQAAQHKGRAGNFAALQQGKVG